VTQVQDVKAHFDQFSSGYKDQFSDKKTGTNHEFRMRLELVADLLRGRTGWLLDCACGTGEITASVLASGKYEGAVVADISLEMLGFAKASISKAVPSQVAQYKQIDIFQFQPEAGGRFNSILCLGLIAHTGQLTKLMTHLKSFLAPGGKIVLQVTLLDHWGTRLVRSLTEKKYQKVRNYKISYYTESDIEREVRAAGLRITDRRYYRFGFPFGDKISKVGNYWLEVWTRRFSAKHGSDAIFVIGA
jgi:2-polyprenyl-3-methyl-5-hydroxy-6-metoxy-1,4-benzoquinol methylase